MARITGDEFQKAEGQGLLGRLFPYFEVNGKLTALPEVLEYGGSRGQIPEQERKGGYRRLGCLYRNRGGGTPRVCSGREEG